MHIRTVHFSKEKKNQKCVKSDGQKTNKTRFDMRTVRSAESQVGDETAKDKIPQAAECIF